MNDYANDHSRKLGIAEGYLMHIAAIGEAPIHDTTPASVLIARVRDMTACAREALVRTGHADVGKDYDAALPEVSRSSHYS